MKKLKYMLFILFCLSLPMTTFCLLESTKDKNDVKTRTIIKWEKTETANVEYTVNFKTTSKSSQIDSDNNKKNDSSQNIQLDENGIIITDDSKLINYAEAATEAPKTLTANYTDYLAPNIKSVIDANAKTYMKYQTLGYENWNKQGHLCRQKEAYTGEYNLRMIDGRVLIAVGSYYTKTIGTYIDVILEDGTVIPSILGDAKSDKHTDSTGQYQKFDMSVVEFIIDSPGSNRYDYSYFKSKYPEIGGNFSNIEKFSSPVACIRVYDKVYDIDMQDMSNDTPDGGK